MMHEEPKPPTRHAETLLVAAVTALVTTLAAKFAERLVERVWPARKEPDK
jgi:hypothetical protein